MNPDGPIFPISDEMVEADLARFFVITRLVELKTQRLEDFIEYRRFNFGKLSNLSRSHRPERELQKEGLRLLARGKSEVRAIGLGYLFALSPQGLEQQGASK